MACKLTGLIGGIDEAGRGPIAGPVVSSCVVWNGPPMFISGIKDSKLLSNEERMKFFRWIMKHAFKVGIGIATHDEIDTENILNATILSMRRAIQVLDIEPDVLLIDGRDGIDVSKQEKTVIRGDRKCFFIACASIVAKVVRDRIMDYYHALYPSYSFKDNKGYKTKGHMEAVKKFGICPVHRKSFSGVKEFADK